NPYNVIFPARSETLTIRAERHTVGLILVPGQDMEQGLLICRTLGIEVPDPDGPIPARGGETAPVRIEGYTVDMPFMGLERNQLLTGGRVPHRDLPILIARGDPPAVGAEDRAEHGSAMVQGGKAFQPSPLQVVPFPAAQVGGAVVKQLFNPAQVI